jgi:hypothetical protein
MPKKRAAKRTTNKSAFIRNLPAETSAADVVAKAKAAGLTLTPAFVYAVRSKSKKAKSGSAPQGARSKAARGGKPSASDFVRTQPATLAASEVVAAGAKQGLKFSTNLVYAVRSAAGKKSGGKRGAGRRVAKAASNAAAGLHATFRKLALDLGLNRAREALEELEQGIAQLIGH